MADPTAAEITTAAKTAAKEALTLGVQSFTHGNRSETLIDPVKALQAARLARSLENEDEYGLTTTADFRERF